MMRSPIFKRPCSSGEKIGDLERNVEILANIGELYARKSQFQDAVDYFDQAIGLAEHLKLDPRLKQELEQHAEVYRNKL